MPYDKTNEKMYVDCTTTPWKGIGTDDLAECFAVVLQKNVDGVVQRIVSLDVGANISAEVGNTIDGWTVVSRRPINKWARYKPECADGPKPLIHGDATSGTRSRFANKFGLEVPYCIHWESANPSRNWHLDLLNGPVSDIMYPAQEYSGWNYLKPRGYVAPSQYEPTAKNEFRRISDFAQVPNDDTDPNYVQNPQTLKGYNHNAPVPFISWMDMAGVTFIEEGSKPDGGYYEINRQIASSIKIFFQNSIGYDLHLQDFIDFNQNSSEPGGIVWRPVIQVFDNDRKYNEATGMYEEWFDRDHEDNRALGPAITTQEGDLWSVELPLGGYTPNQNKTFHLCIGIGLVNDNYEWGQGNKALFVLPYTDEQAAQKKWPFHYEFAVVEHNARTLDITILQWYNGGTPVSATGTPPWFDVGRFADGGIWLTMEITKLPTQKLHFVAENGTADSGYTPLWIKVKQLLPNSSQMTEYYLTPKNNSQKVEQGQSTTKATIEGKSNPDTPTPDVIDLSDIGVGESAQYYVQTKIGNDGGWVDNSFFRIRKLNS